MFEECFSMIEIGFSPAIQTAAQAAPSSDDGLDELQAILLETLEKALSSLDDDLPVLH